jgi:hypothetical protein
MKLLNKLILPLVVLAGLMLATPAQARWHHHYYHHYYSSYGYPYYGPAYYGGPYYGYYGGPYYGSGVTVAFGGHSYRHHRHWR